MVDVGYEQRRLRHPKYESWDPPHNRETRGKRPKTPTIGRPISSTPGNRPAGHAQHHHPPPPATAQNPRIYGRFTVSSARPAGPFKRAAPAAASGLGRASRPVKTRGNRAPLHPGSPATPGILPHSRRAAPTVSWLPTTYTWSKRFSGLHSLLVSPKRDRPESCDRTSALPRRQSPAGDRPGRVQRRRSATRQRVGVSRRRPGQQAAGPTTSHDLCCVEPILNPSKAQHTEEAALPGESVRPDASESPTSASGQARPTTRSTASARASSGPHGTTATRRCRCAQRSGISLPAAATGRRSALQRSGFSLLGREHDHRERARAEREGPPPPSPAAWSTATADVDGTSSSPTRERRAKALGPEAPRGQRHPASAPSPKLKPAARRRQHECNRRAGGRPRRRSAGLRTIGFTRIRSSRPGSLRRALSWHADHAGQGAPHDCSPSIAIVRRRLLRTHLLGDRERAQGPRDR